MRSLWFRLVLMVGARVSSQDVAGAKAVDEWFQGRAAAPPHWSVRDASDVPGKWKKLSSGFYKQVHVAALSTGEPVVVKRRKLYPGDDGRLATLSGEPLRGRRVRFLGAPLEVAPRPARVGITNARCVGRSCIWSICAGSRAFHACEAPGWTGTARGRRTR